MLKLNALSLIISFFGGRGNGDDNNVNQESEIISTEQLDGTGNNKYPIRRKEGYDAPAFQGSLLEFRFEVFKKILSYRCDKFNSRSR